ncbi:hypothetical protein KC19_9G160000 [Ceratodon purpureus]|uniref:Phospholipase D n=2 Tax=Ceratodon purpureus TaxID=3225 RepID=A0A8T0GXZ3_CERPU|nr:hypothetical protein KC19_9G160000 [Ceratodon purpureus]
MTNCLLHGTLHATIYEGRHMTSERRTGGAPAFFRKIVEGAEDVLSLGKGVSKYYATVDLTPARVGRTGIVKGQPKTPVWNESFRIYCCHSVASVTVSVKDAAILGTAVIGRADVPAQQLLNGEPVEDWYPLYKDNEKAGNSEIRFRLQFFQASHDPHWGLGISDPRYPGVPYCYFPQREGCKVTLYQDAHMEDGFLPPIYLSGGAQRQPTRCWEDIFEAISNAKHFIYITGWSVYTEITLVRDPSRQLPGSLNVTLGELLKKKATEGVRVNMLVWDDRTAVDWVQPAGLMGTHCLQTEDYFEGTDVNCYLCPRNPDDSLSLVQGFTISTMFTHHQKSVILDAPLPGQGESGQRRVMSFVGGIDLCDGRYDNQRHSLFHTLDNLHAHDFHQPNFPDTSIEKGGPREPWHDIHSKLEGPIAWDVLYNFEQRWRQQATHLEVKLLPIRDIGTIDPPSAVTFDDDPETWHVQFFRSIDAGAAYGFPEVPEVAERAGLVSGKDNVIDRSIQDAYINAIRRAKDFIYIENQYFLGSSFGWKQDQDAGADHLIPAELTRKITSKIADGERFTVYIVMPMWPEGIPDSGSVQAILKWTMNTMEMMYTEIATALRASGVQDATPQDYLTFFCLANRETKLQSDYVPTQRPEEGSLYMKAQDARRFMIYVHAKMMIGKLQPSFLRTSWLSLQIDGGKYTICVEMHATLLDVIC